MMDFCDISIHAPSRGRQRLYSAVHVRGGISIHAPSRGRPALWASVIVFFNFNPRPLAGATIDCLTVSQVQGFQSTPPRGGDVPFGPYVAGARISIHAPSRGRLPSIFITRRFAIFQSTPPRGGDRPHQGWALQ